MILLYKGKSLISKAIQWRTWGIYSHAAWWMRDGSVIEAWHKGGVSHSESPATLHTPGTQIDLFDFCHIDAVSPPRSESFLLSKVGRKYDFKAVLRGFTFHLNRDNPDKWFCSELCHAAAVAGGLPLLSRIPDWKIDPTKLSYSPHLTHVGILTTLDQQNFNFQTVDAVSSPRFQPLENSRNWKVPHPCPPQEESPLSSSPLEGCRRRGGFIDLPPPTPNLQPQTANGVRS